MGVWCSSINPKSSEDYFSDFFTHIWENVVVVHLDSHVRLFATLWTAACQPSLSFTISQSLLKLMSIEWMMPFSHLILCLSLLLLLSIFPSIRGSSNELALHITWPEYWRFSFNINPSSEYSGLISFRMNWLDPLGTPRDSQESFPTPQFKSINSLALSFPYSPTLISIHDYWKNHSFTIQTFVGKIMSLLFNMLSRFVIALENKVLKYITTWK